MNQISKRRPLFLALLAAASLGLTGCAVKDGKWAPFSYAVEGCGDYEGCDRDHGSDSSGSSGGYGGGPT